MKKITLMTLLFVFPMLMIGQTFDFTNTDDGWSAVSGFTPTTGASAMTLTTNDGDELLKNPTCGTIAAGVDTTVNNYVGVTLSNRDATGPDFIRVSYPKTDSGRIYKNLDITTADADFVTYWFDLSNATHWVGTMNDIKLHFKSAGNSDYFLPNSPNNVSIDIDKIEFVDELPRVEKLSYDFNTDGDNEGWSTEVDATAVVSGGSLTLTPTAVGSAIAKVTNGVNSVDADANSYMHIVYRNLSADNDQLRIQFKSSVDNYLGFSGTNVAIDPSMSEFATIDLDLETLKPEEWSGMAQDLQIALRNTENAGNASAAGDLVIDRIVFDNSATLTLDEFDTTTISVYPNPAKTMVNIRGLEDVAKVELFDITGKKVFETTKLINNQFNVEAFNSGVYLLKIVNTKNNVTVRRLIVD